VYRALQQRRRADGPALAFDADLRSLEFELPTALAGAPDACALVLDEQGRVQPWTGELTQLARERAHRAEAGQALPPCLLPLDPRQGEGGLHQLLALVAADGAAFAVARLIPWFATDPERAGADADTRLAESWAGLLPGDHYRPRMRALVRALHGTLWPDRHALFLALENAALAGCDLYLETLLGRELAPSAPPAPAAPKPLLLAVCGIDGAGKSFQLAALQEWLQARGLRVAVHKLYRHGLFHDTVTDLARQCAGDHHLHLWRLERLAKLMDSVKYLPQLEGDLATCDVILFDRSVWTHFAAGAGRLHHDPFAREMLATVPAPHRTFLLDLPVPAALARIAARPQRTTDENEYMLGRYRAVLHDLAILHGQVVLDATRPPDEVQAAIRVAIGRLLP
jgi:thymidylate kinase